jgi:hypothetical protein
MSIGQADGRPGAEGMQVERREPDGGRQRDEAFAALLRGGDTAAFGLLFDAWADPVYDRISHRGFTTADATRIEVDSFVATHRRIVQQGATDPFRVLVLRASGQAMTANDAQRVDLHLPVGPYAEDRLIRSAEVRTLATDPAVVSFLWEAAEVLGHQVREVLDLHYRHRLTAAEVAVVMQETPASIDAILTKVEAGYNAVVRSKIMWRQGGPSHDQLAAAVSGHQTFDTSVVKLVAEHLRTCQGCRDASQVPVRPVEVFAAIPLTIAPPGFKESVVEDLTAAGVDMSGSASTRRSGLTAPAVTKIAGAAGVAGVAGVAAAEIAQSPAGAEPKPSERKPARGRGRSEDAAAAGRAVGLAAFAGPVDGLVDTRSSEPRTAASVGAEPAYAAAGAAGVAKGGSGGDAPAGGSKKGWLFAAAAAAVVLVLLAVVLLGGSSSKHPTTKLAAGSSQSTTTVAPTTVPGSPTTIPASTAVPTTVASPGSSVSSSTSTTAKTTGSTPVTVKSSPPPPGVTTTTAVPFPNVTLNFNIPTRTITGSWDTTVSNAPQAIWSVTASGPVTVSMSGPGLSSSAASGDARLCPGNLGGSGGTICTTAAGVYSYTIVVKDSLGRTVRTQTLSLTVT